MRELVVKMSNFKSTTLATLPSIIEPLSDSAKYWQNSLESAKVAKEFSAINCIDINSMHDILVTSSTRLAVYEYYSMEVKRSYNTPNMVPLFGANYRKSDSKLIVAGCADGVVRVWDTRNSKPLRALGLNDKKMKHSSAVRRTHFCDNSKILSFGDDYQIKLWDITEECVVSTFGSNSSANSGVNTAHKDYIRASHVCQNSSTFISGSYDHCVKIWDNRSPQNAVAEVDHGSPVESVTVRDLVAISAGRDTIKIFDLIAGKVFKTLVKTHHKTITSVYNFGHYLLTASIDGHLKVYDSNFNVASSLSYTPSQLLCCALDDKVVAVGANDGLFSVRKFKSNSKESNSFKLKRKASNNRYFMGEDVFDDMNAKRKANMNFEENLVIKGKSKGKGREKLARQDELLKQFNYSMALSRVINKNSGEPEVVVSFMQELIRRSGLKTALIGRSDKDLAPIIRFIENNLSDPRFNRILVDVALILTDLYMSEINRSNKIQSMFQNLSSAVNSELNCLQQMLGVCGQLSAIINTSVE